MDSVIHRYLERARRLFGPVGGGDGIPREELSAAEGRLRMPLPGVLRQVYLACGRRADLHTPGDRLLAPDELAIEGDMLVFYEGRERTCLWGVPLAELRQEDPPVRVTGAREPFEWRPEAERLSVFLEAMLLQQRMELAPWVLKRKVGHALLRQFEALYPPLSVGGRIGRLARWFGREGFVLRIQGAAPFAVVTVAAPTGSALMELGQWLEVEWSDAAWADCAAPLMDALFRP